jgi:hypothetical protein
VAVLYRSKAAYIYKVCDTSPREVLTGGTGTVVKCEPHSDDDDNGGDDYDYEDREEEEEEEEEEEAT